MGTKRQDNIDKVNNAHWLPSDLNIGRAANQNAEGSVQTTMSRTKEVQLTQR
jgi:hypothetical protein